MRLLDSINPDFEIGQLVKWYKVKKCVMVVPSAWIL